MKKTPFVVMGVVLIFSTTVLGQGISFHGKARNSFYSYESQQKHTRLYQYAQFGLATADNNITVSASLRALTDTETSLDTDERFKAYSLNLQLKKLLKDRVDLTIGRQFLHPGAVLGALDGLYGTAKIAKNLSLGFYGGVEAQLLRGFTIPSDAYQVAGGLLQVSNVASSKAQLLYLQKTDDSHTIWQLAGVNLDNAGIAKTHLRLQAHYDLQNDRMHRLLISSRTAWSDRVSTGLEFKSQRPQVYANSFFTIFEAKPYNQFRVSGSLEFTQGFYLDGQYFLVSVEDDNANRVFFSLRNDNGSLGFIYENGFAGEQVGVMFDYAYEVLPRLIASVYVDYSKYRSEEIYEEENQLGNAARISYQLNRMWRIDAEYQWLSNRFKETDSRFLNHVSFSW